MFSLCCVCIGASKQLGTYKHIRVYIQGASKHTGGHPIIWGMSKHMEASKHTGEHPNIWGVSKHTGGIQMYGGIWNPLSLTKHVFFVLCMYRGIQTIGDIQTYQGIHTGGIQTYRWASNHMGDVQTYGGIQTYR